jgi:cell division inhibitor SepF
MEELELQEKSGFFTRIAGVFSRNSAVEDELHEQAPQSVRYWPHNRYQITVRRQVVSFQDAVAAADGLKRGEQQILNLTGADNSLREKIKDFMCGVNYAEEGTWEELGDNIFLLAPPQAVVDVAPATPRMSAVKN